MLLFRNWVLLFIDTDMVFVCCVGSKCTLDLVYSDFSVSVSVSHSGLGLVAFRTVEDCLN